MIDSISMSPTLTTAQEKYFEYKVTYSDGIELADNHKLSANSTETLKVSFKYLTSENASDYPTSDEDFACSIGVNYIQADNNATTVSHSSTVYTANIWDGNNSIMNGVTNTSEVWIGQTIPNGITTYQTPALAMAALKQASGNVDRPFFLKHTITNNIVTDSYLGFVVTDAMAQSNPGMTAGTYYLKGTKTKEYVNGSWQCMSQYDDGNGNCLDPDYNVNKATLLSAFGSSYCIDHSSNFSCYVSRVNAYADSHGEVNASDGSWYCVVSSNGGSVCYDL